MARPSRSLTEYCSFILNGVRFLHPQRSTAPSSSTSIPSLVTASRAVGPIEPSDEKEQPDKGVNGISVILYNSTINTPQLSPKSINMASPFEPLSPFSFSSRLSVIIRFSIPIPDLQLTIASPTTTTAQSLNALIRPHLPRAHAASPLRLIAAGALLPPTIPISVSLRLPPPRPPPPPSTSTAATATAQDKPLPAHSISSFSKQLPAPVYIHCAISPTSAPRLSASALAAERAPYIPSSPLPLSQSRTSSPLPTSSAAHIVPAVGANPLPPPPPPPPLGFDRLLSAGFSASEVASLRAQFRAQTALAHTPDTMPDPAQLLVLEERWLEAGPRGGTGTGSGGGGGDQDEGDVEGEPGALMDMLWGNVMGFFWALGGVLWLIREEGVWSRRRQVAVVTGMLVNVAFGILKVTS